MSKTAAVSPVFNAGSQKKVFTCERCGFVMRPEHAHDVCDRCGWMSHCCEGDLCQPSGRESELTMPKGETP